LGRDRVFLCLVLYWKLLMSIVLGVDLGTTKITSIALDTSAREVVAVGTVANDANITSDADRNRGRSEWDADQIVTQGIACLQLVAERLGDRASQVQGIGVTGQQHGMLLVDRTGEPISPLINWQDRRALDQVKGGDRTWLEETRMLLGEDVWKRTGCRLQPGFMAGTLYWLKAHDRLTKDSKALFIMDLFGSVLTGQPAVTEPSCAGSSGVFNVRTRQWDPESIAALGLSASLFPEIREANEQIGTLTPEVASATGLSAGIPIYAPIGDHQASFLGSITDRTNSVLVNVGTGAQVAVFTEGFDFVPPIELRPFPRSGNLLSNVGLAGGWSYQVLEQFFRDVGRAMFQQQGTAALYEQLNRLAGSVPAGADGLRCDPSFAGTRLDPGVRGAITGLSPQNFTARHLARAVLEGMGRSLREGYAAIERVTGQSHSKLVAAGNGLRENPLLSEIVAEAFGLPISFTEYREEAAVGAALIAAGL
jgi:sugar (pentulose or hexulose) kinase